MKSYISRKDAIDAICKNCNYTCEGICTDYENLMALPPADVRENVRWEWIPVGVVEVVGGESTMWGSAVAYHKCSRCDGQALKDDFDEEVLSDFCPHCGAKMTEGTIDAGTKI